MVNRKPLHNCHYTMQTSTFKEHLILGHVLVKPISQFIVGTRQIVTGDIVAGAIVGGVLIAGATVTEVTVHWGALVASAIVPKTEQLPLVQLSPEHLS